MNTFILLNQYGINFIRFSWIMLLQSSVLILILLGLDFLLRRKVKAVFRYSLWMLLLVKLVLPVGLALPCSPAYWACNFLPESEFINNAPVLTSLTESSPANVSKGDKASSSHVNEMSAVMQLSTDASVNALVKRPQIFIPWQSFAALGWLIVVLIMMCLLIQHVFFVNSLIRRSKPADQNLLSRLNRCIVRMNMRQEMNLRISPTVTSPSACGLFRPVILIPENLTSYLTAGQIDAVLMHELAHIKRGDLWVNLVQGLLQIIYFYNPLLWISNAVIRRIREQAVDEMVLVAMDEQAEEYPETLLKVSKLVWSRPMLSLRLIGVVESRSALAIRIKHIMSRPFPKTAKIGFVGLAAIFVAGAVLLPMAKGDIPPLHSGGKAEKETGASAEQNEKESLSEVVTATSGHNVDKSDSVPAYTALSVIQKTQVSPIFYEPFSKRIFPEGFMLGRPRTPDKAKNGWTSGNTTSEHGCSYVSSSAALSYEGLEIQSDSNGVVRAANTSASNRNAGKPFGTTITEGSVYCSFLMKVVSLPTANRCLISLNRSTGSDGFTNPAACIWLDAKGRLLIGKNRKTNEADTTAVIGDETVFVVLKYTFKDGPDNDEVALYLNPQPGRSEPAKPSLLTTNGADISKLMAVGLPQGKDSSFHGANSGNICLDEIRVGTEWGDVTPAAEAISHEKTVSANLLFASSPTKHFKQAAPRPVAKVALQAIDSSDEEDVWLRELHEGQAISSCGEYAGDSKTGKPDGHGVWTHPSGVQYVGEFRDGKFEGHGTLTAIDGSTHVGEYRDGKRNGLGTLALSDGTVYVGNFKDGKRNGRGKLTYPDGKVEEGNWKKDRFIEN